MNIREKFLENDMLNMFNMIEKNELQNQTIINKLVQIKKIMNQGIDKSEYLINLSQQELKKINTMYGINSDLLEHRDLVKEIIENVNYQSEEKYPVMFAHNLLLIDKVMIENLLEKNTDRVVLRELTQLLCLIKMQKAVSIKEIITIKDIPLDYNEQFIETMVLEKRISNKIQKSMTFIELIDNIEGLYLENKASEYKLLDTGKSIYAKAVQELASIVLIDPEEENLIEFKDGKICFNMHSFNMYSQIELNKDRKRELVQALKLIINEQDNEANNYSYILFQQQEKIVSLLEKRISEEDIDYAISKLPTKKREISPLKRQQIMNLLKVNEKDRFIIFENETINMSNLENLMTPEFKKEQIISYFIIMSGKDNENMECKLLNNKTINFNSFKDMFYIEDLLQRQLTQYSLSDILQTIHDFKKDKIFNQANEKIIDYIISDKFVQKFSYNNMNKEMIFINESRCVFNEKIISNIDNIKNDKLLEMYLLCEDRVVKELGENITIDNRVSNLQKYKIMIEDKLKYQVNEKDIMNALENIEKKSNTLIQSKKEVFQTMSITLNAKEVYEISNDIVQLSLHEGLIAICSFNEVICDKLLKKELTETSKREFCQALLLYEVKNKNTEIKNPKEYKVKIHDNFEKIDEYKDKIREKLMNNIVEEEINQSVGYLVSQLHEESQRNIQTSITVLKKKLGIKGQSIFKSRL